MEVFDVIIIGSGGGTKLRPAADLGHRVAIIEKDQLGGTCLNRGCIPSKMLIYPGELLHQANGLGRFGVHMGKTQNIDWEKLVGRVHHEVHDDSQSIAKRYDDHANITYIKGHARFTAAHTIEVNGRMLSAPRIYIATGARPFIPPVPGLAETPYWTSTEALFPKKQPESLVVIGGGYIAMELGTFYANVGIQTTFVVRSGLLAAEDKDVRHRMEEYMPSHYDVRLFTDVLRVEHREGVFYTTICEKDGATSVVKSEQLLVATGIVPNSDDLGLEHTNIECTKEGRIRVNEYLETAESGIFALGDVVGHHFFRHNVNFEGEYLWGQHFGGEKKCPIVYPPMPHAVFSTPQIAGVGVTEDELELAGKQRGEDYIVAIQNYKDSAMGMAMKPDVGMVKLIFDVSSRELLGAHIIGDRASDIIHMLIYAITHRATLDDLAEMIYIHPALSEVIRNAVREARSLLR